MCLLILPDYQKQKRAIYAKPIKAQRFWASSVCTQEVQCYICSVQSFVDNEKTVGVIIKIAAISKVSKQGEQLQHMYNFSENPGILIH